MSITTQANPPAPYDWASKSIDEMLADVQALVEQISDGPCACCADTILIPAGPLHDTLTFTLAAESRLRRTRGGQWAIDGRRYRTKALALESAKARIMEPLWPALLAPAHPRPPLRAHGPDRAGGDQGRDRDLAAPLPWAKPVA